jgi:hypothetical protein
MLNLEKIDHDLAPLLRHWHGHFLYVTDCPRFDDALLDAMSATENGVFVHLTRVANLTIKDCPNFSVAALRRFVESRLDLPDVNFLWVNVTPRIRSVRFVGNVPAMSQAEKAWFSAPVAY